MSKFSEEEVLDRELDVRGATNTPRKQSAPTLRRTELARSRRHRTVASAPATGRPSPT